MDLEQKIMEIELGGSLPNVPEGYMGFMIYKPAKKYKIYAYPGEEVSGQFRAEHLPYHCHIKNNNKQLYRISFESGKLNELDNKNIPRNLKKYLLNNSEIIQKRIEEVFHTGKYTN
jgi:hypothetical protein